MSRFLDDNAPRAGIFLFHTDGYVLLVQKPRSPKFGFMLDGKMRVAEVLSTLSQREVFLCSRARTLTQILAEHRQKYHTRALNDHEIENILSCCQMRLLNVDQPYPPLQYEIPKGGSLPGEASENTALRETLEEVPSILPHLQDRRLECIRASRSETIFAALSDVPILQKEVPTGSDELSRALWAKIIVSHARFRDSGVSFRSCGNERFDLSLIDEADGSEIEVKPRWFNDLVNIFDHYLGCNAFSVPLIPSAKPTLSSLIGALE